MREAVLQWLLPAEGDEPLPLGERLGLTIAVLVLYGLYFPIGVLTAARPTHTLVTSVDAAIPLVPGWMWAYAFVYLVGLAPLAVVGSRQVFRGTVAAYTSVICASLLIFGAWPVEMVLRPRSWPTDTFTNWGLVLCYWLDPPTNCMPSLHVSIAFLGALCCLKVDRAVGRGLLVAAAAIAASTLLVKQHYLADVALALALALAAHRRFIRPLPVAEGDAARMPRTWLGALVALYALAIGGLYLAYLAGWAPWAS